MSDVTPRAALVTVGDELVLGETVDTNAAWLGRALAAMGIRVQGRQTVGDDETSIRVALRRALDDGSQLVVLTGGLGPTSDDLTRPAVARELGRRLLVDDALVEGLRARFRRRGLTDLPRTNLVQAEVPEGAEVLPNPRGTAPGILIEATPGGALVALLPGVPSEMKGIFEEELAPRVRERLAARLRPLRHRIIHTTGVSESLLAARIEDTLPADPADPVGLAYLPQTAGVDLRLTVNGVADAEEAERHLDRVESHLADIVGPFRFEAPGSGDLVEAVSGALAERGFRVATGESCTGGLIAKRMTDLAGSSTVFEGGVVAYADGVKASVLGVPRDVLAREGAVSEPVARAMAEGAARALGCACGIGVTGIAGPGGGSDDKPVGLVWYAAAVEGRVEARREVFPGDRDAIRHRSAQAALALLLRMLLAADGGARP